MVVVALVFLVGPLLNVGSPTFSGTNLISAAMLFPLMGWLLVERLSFAGVLAVVGMGLLLTLSLIAVATQPTPENARLVRAVIVGCVAIAAAAWTQARHPALVTPIVLTALVTAAAVAALQASFLLGGPGLDPKLEERLLETLSSGVFSIGLPSFFGNPNNFSVFAGLVFIWSTLHPTAGRSVPLLAVACVGASRSRAVLAVIVLWYLLQLLASRRFAAFLAWSGVMILATAMLSASTVTTGIYAIDRLQDAVNSIASGELTAGSSLDVRGRSHLYFAQHYSSFLRGSFDAGREIEAFASTDFDDSLIRQNPHSLIIELHALFGAFGLAALVLLATAFTSRVRTKLGAVRGFALLMAIVAFSTVPSQVLHFHPFFLLVTLLAAGDCGARSRRAVRDLRRDDREDAATRGRLSGVSQPGSPS